MANQGKVVKLGLEEVVLSSRERGRSLAQIAADCNAALRAQRSKDTVSKPAVERYLATLDKASVAPAHQPQLAERNARTAIDFAGDLHGLRDKVSGWLEEADTATRTVMVGYGESAYTEIEPHWDARTKVAREFRELLKLYADVMERVANAQHVQEFQRIIFDAIKDADAETANKILASLRKVREARQAGMLGLD